MTYIVFARKWRPQTFKEIAGQEHVTTTLQNAITSDRIAHAYLFTGPRGIGKTSMARIFAKAINCENGPTVTPCNKCASCKEITSSTSMDVLEIDGASNTSVDQIRELRENVKLSPSTGRYKIYIIDEIHMLSTSAFNALLKTLEEPPAHVKFIFATTQSYKVLPTIISRCQRFDFKRISSEEINFKLKKIAKAENIDIEDDALFAVAAQSDGSLRDAESVFDQLTSYKQGKITSADVASMLGIVNTEVYFNFTKHIAEKDPAALLTLINCIVSEGKDLYQFMSGLIEHFRNRIVLKVSEELTALVPQTEENINRLIETNKHFGKEELLYAFSILINTQQTMRRSSDMRIPLEVTAVKLTRLAELKTLPQVLEQLKNISAKGFSGESMGTTEINSPVGTAEVSRPRKAETTAKSSFTENDNSPEPPIIKSVPVVNATNPEGINSQWPDFIENIKKESMLIGLYLGEGSISKAEEHSLTIGFHNEGNLHIDYLDRRENRQIIEDKLNEFFGRKMKVFLIKLEGKPEQKAQSQKPAADKSTAEKPAFENSSIINSALNIFGGTIIEEK
ncbi:MAG: DNA polymerase III subunit gamma/tau [Candidatus Omnitrophota bacterium]